eukprot:Gb_00780 [translate_table: standard]
MKYYFAIFLFTIAIPSTSAISNLLADGAALLSFKQGLDSYSPKYLNWTPTDDSPCSWTGVSCYRDGSSVRSLNLSSFGLWGRLTTSLGQLTGLVALDLSSNSLYGEIVPEIGNCSRLKTLFLNDNEFSDSIPVELSRLTELTNLDLGGNTGLSGSIPFQLGRLKNLEYLGLGVIPPELGRLANLTRLDLHSNRLVGSIPTQFAELTNLVYLDLSNNLLSGSIPPMKLQSLNLSHNQLSGASGAICLCGGLVYIWFRRRTNVQKLKMETVEDLPQDLVLKEILEATGDLTEDSVIGEGRHGIVFKLEMPSGKIYAVKKLTFGFMNTSFTLEVETLGSVRHRNLIKIVGFWACQTWGLIIYEYMSNGNLYQLLHEINPPPVLNWEVRYRIALGIAHGLAYLHHDCVPQIIHRDIKSANILMNSDLEPHIADFCLAKPIHSAADKDLNSWYAVVGTLGYIAPENGYSTRVDEKSDVYSYGVVLLELLTRKKAVDSRFEEGEEIVSWVKRRLEEHRRNPLDFMDEEMWDWTEKERDEALKLLKLAMICIRAKPESRPSMKAIVDELKEFKSSSSYPSSV